MGNVKEKVKLNSEQEASLDISKSLALRAGAGSGKTRVLTERYLKLLREVDGICVDNIVAITFTNKAALEMKERIREGISWEIASETDSTKSLKWKKVRDDISNSNINTIHGFCEKIIKENFWYLGIDPEFKILDEVDRETNLREIVKDSINTYFSTPSNIGVNEYFKLYGTKKVMNDGLAWDLTRVYSKIREMGLPFETVKSLTSFENKQKFFNEADYDEQIIKDINAVENLALNIIIEINKKYEDFKTVEGGMDFNDLEILTLKALENPQISQFYKGKYKFFLVDEFQDVNPIQKNILYHFVCDEKEEIEPKKLFIVGDHKQAIYGFRGTDYSIFNEICDKLDVKYLSTCYRSTPEIIHTVNKIFNVLLNPYEELKPKENLKFENKKVELIRLQKEETEEGTDDSWKIISKLIGSDDESEELEGLLETLKNKGAVKEKKDKYAKALAIRINELVKEGFEFKDIAILIRSKTNIGLTENALRSADIPYCIMGGIGFWGRQEILDIVNLYRFIVNSNDLVSLIGVLRSPIFGFSDNLILELADFLSANGKNAFKALEELKNDATQESEKVKRAYEILTELKSFDGILSAHELIKNICKLISYKQILLTQTNGYQKVRNLEKLIQISKDFDSKNLYSAREFPLYIDVLKGSSSNEGEAVLDTEDSNAVKILTIHGSKGLQFKAVMIPDIHSDIFKMSKINKPQFVIDEQFGITASLITGEGKDKTEQNLLYKEFYDNKLKREFEDSKRVLYVAMTRAQNFLCLIGEDQEYKDENNLNTYMKQIKFAVDSNDENIEYLDIKDFNNYSEESNGRTYSFEKIDESIKKISDLQCDEKDIKNLLWKYDGQALKMFSISQYMQYLECPRKYYYRYISRVNEEMLNFDDVYEVDGVEFVFDEVAENQACGVPANVRGSIVHKIFEEAALEKVEDENELLSLGRKIASNWLRQEQFEKLGFISEVERYVKNYLNIEETFEKEVSGAKLKTLVELPFRIPISEDKNILINGVIDRIDVYENEECIDLYIIDYKTNAVRSHEDVEKFKKYYLPQLMIYYSAAKMLVKDKNKPARVMGAYLYFVDNGECGKVEFTEEDVEKFIAELSGTFGKISRMDKMEQYECGKKGPGCIGCVGCA